MAYDKTKYQLTRLLQDAWYKMGQFKTWTATGGSTTTTVNSTWAGVEEQIFEDDDPALIYGTVVVVKDAAGTGAAPEGEMAMITDYDSSSNTITHDALTTAVAVGDKVGVATPSFPMEDMIALANIAMRKLGDLDLVDTSLSTVAATSEYTLPASIQKTPTRVRIQTSKLAGDYQWEVVQGWSVIPATAGSNWTLILPFSNSGYLLEVSYRDIHPTMYTFSDNIQSAIEPELAVCALVAEAYQWYNNQIGGSNQYFVQRENKALQDLEQAMVKHPIRHMINQVQGMPHWGARGEYVPGTSDLKYGY